MPPLRTIVLIFSRWPEPPLPGSPRRKQTRVAAAEEAAEATVVPDFEPVFARLTEIVPEVEVVRPGLVAMRARGPARYYGGEAAAAEALLEFARAEGDCEPRVGIADGRFAAEQAARAVRGHAALSVPSPGVRIVAPSRSAEFVGTLPVSQGAPPELATLLSGLGIHTLGAFAALPEGAVRARFGPAGMLTHRHARGLDAERGDEIRPVRPVRDFTEHLDFEPPIDSAEHLAFACATLAERLADSLSEERLVCTSLRITLTDDIGARREREWSHPKFFTPADIIARLRWQASGSGPEPGALFERGGAGIAAVTIAPIRTDRIAAHEPGLWNTGPDERVHHHLSRAQGLLGPHGACTATLTGGRLLLERQRFTPWGVAPPRLRTEEIGPWPGALPDPQPSLVFSPPLRAKLLSPSGAPVTVNDDDLLAERPHTLRVEGHSLTAAVRGWSRPWPLRERWWEGRPERFRVQVELENGDAWLLLARRPASWFAEGHYD